MPLSQILEIQLTRARSITANVDDFLRTNSQQAEVKGDIKTVECSAHIIANHTKQFAMIDALVAQMGVLDEDLELAEHALPDPKIRNRMVNTIKNLQRTLNSYILTRCEYIVCLLECEVEVFQLGVK